MVWKEENCNWIPKAYPPCKKPQSRSTPLAIEIAPALQTCTEDVVNWCVLYTTNCMVITRTTSIPITRTPTGDVSYATRPRKVMSEMEDSTMQKVGMRDDKEKKTYEPYRSWERCCEWLFSRWGQGQKCTHNKSLQVYPIIMDQEPYSPVFTTPFDPCQKMFM